MKKSIIICTYNRFLLLCETIESIVNLLIDEEDWELIIVDNNSTDDTSKIKDMYRSKHIRYVFEHKQGLSNARNRGISESVGDVLIFLDDDLELNVEYFNVCENLLLNPHISIVGGKVLPHNIEIPSWLPQKFYYLVSVFDLGEKSLYSSKIMGANFFIRMKAIKEIGWYNTELGRNGDNLLGGEEVDYINRAINLGYLINYEPQLIVYHKINNKINTRYIYNYSLNLAKSELIIDFSLSKQKVLIKFIKSLLAFILFYCYGWYAYSSKQRVFHTINLQYAKGYLSGLVKLWKRENYKLS